MKHTEGRIVIRVDMEVKNSHRFQDGTTIRLERGWNNLNRREVAPVNAIVVSAEGIPAGVELLCHHNSFHETYQIFNHGQLSGSEIAGKINYYSIPEQQAYIWRDGDTWRPIKGYATGLKVFKPYKGLLQGIPNSEIKDTLYVTSGDLAGNVCHTVRAAAYEMIFQGLDGIEHRLIRFRHNDDPEAEEKDYKRLIQFGMTHEAAKQESMREELTCISGYLTDSVKRGDVYIGLSETDCKPLKELTNAVHG